MRMLHLFTGHDLFLDAIRLFLKRYSYKTATAIDFWTCVEEITELPISIKSYFFEMKILVFF
jgi:aminopeptidase N